MKKSTENAKTSDLTVRGRNGFDRFARPFPPAPSLRELSRSDLSKPPNLRFGKAHLCKAEGAP